VSVIPNGCNVKGTYYMSTAATVVRVSLEIFASARTQGFANCADRGTRAALTRCPCWTLDARWISYLAVKIQEA
jgi:hypothetical protein